MQQQDPSTICDETRNITTSGNPIKTRYRYFVRHEVLENSNDLRKQTMRRMNPKFVSFRAKIDNDTSNEDQKVRKFRDLLNVIQTSKRFSKLELYTYRENHQIRVRELLMLMKALKRHSTLQSLDFEFLSWKYAAISDYHLQKLGQGLKTFSKLQDIRLAFNPYEITRRGFYAIARPFNTADFLKTIDWEKHKREQFEIKRFNGMKSHFKRLTNFHLVFLNPGLPVGGYKQRYPFVFHLDGPQKRGFELISLKFLTGPGFQELNKALKETQSFRHLKIKFSESPDSHEEEIQKLSENLKRLSSLTSFDLAFLSNGSYPEAEIFVRLVGQSLEQLNSLKHFGFSCSGEKTSELFLESLCSGLRRLSSLESVSLQFERLDQVFFQRFQSLQEALFELNHLQKLNLSFSHTKFYEGEDNMNSLFQGLEKLSSLKELNLEFSKCPKISDKEVEVLCQHIKKISSLQKLGFKFETYLRVLTPEGIEKFRENLAHLQCNIVEKWNRERVNPPTSTN